MKGVLFGTSDVGDLKSALRGMMLKYPTMAIGLRHTKQPKVNYSRLFKRRISS
jgi:hypothetical protein